MNVIVSFTLVIAGLVTVSTALGEGEREQFLSTVAKSVAVENFQLVFTTHDQGQRFFLVIDADPPRLLSYNETVRFPRSFGKASLYSRHIRIDFARISEGAANFEVTKTVQRHFDDKEDLKIVSELRLLENAFTVVTRPALANPR